MLLLLQDMRPDVEVKIKQLEQLDMIEKVTAILLWEVQL